MAELGRVLYKVVIQNSSNFLQNDSRFKIFYYYFMKKIKKRSINLPALQNDFFFHKLIKLILE